MSFKFTKIDDFESLDQGIRDHLPVVIKNRINEFEKILPSIEACDFSAVCRYCHNVEGVAASYHLFKLDEIVRYLHKLAKEENFSEITPIIAEFKGYFSELEALSI